MTARVGGAVVARASRTLEVGRAVTVVVRLSARGRALLARARRVRLVLTIALPGLPAQRRVVVLSR